MSGGGQEEEDQLAIFASDEEWAALEGALDGFELVDDDEGMEGLLDPSDEVVRVSRRIAGQYVEVLARFSASAFGRDGSAVSVDQVKSAIDALLRLARAATDESTSRVFSAYGRLHRIAVSFCPHTNNVGIVTLPKRLAAP